MLITYPVELKNRLSTEFGVEWAQFDPISRVQFSVDDREVDLGRMGVTRFDIPGRVRIKGRDIVASGFNVEELPEIIFGLLDFGAAQRSAQIESDGSFVLRSMFPGQFFGAIDVSRLGESWYVSAMTRRGVDLLANGLTIVGSADSPIDVMLADDAGGIEGSVRNDGNGISGRHVRVILIPPPSRRGVLSRFPSTTADQLGEFALSGVAPGQYRLVAVWEPANPSRNPYWQSPEFLDRYERYGEEVTVRPNESRVVVVEVAVTGE
jgi:hypothetical protein